MGEETRERCPFCLKSEMTDIPARFEGAGITHPSCLDEFQRLLSNVAKNDPMRAARIMAATDTDDPTWGARTLRMLRGEEEPPPLPFPDRPTSE